MSGKVGQKKIFFSRLLSGKVGPKKKGERWKKSGKGGERGVTELLPCARTLCLPAMIEMHHSRPSNDNGRSERNLTGFDLAWAGPHPKDG